MATVKERPDDVDHAKETAEALEAAADRLDGAAQDVRRLAKRMRETGDLTYAGEAASVVAQVVGQCRLDLFVIRPLRAQGIR
jgi:signal transduction histidine kinase